MSDNFDKYIAVVEKCLGHPLAGWQKNTAKTVLSDDKTTINTMPQRMTGSEQKIAHLLDQLLRNGGDK